MKGGGNMRVMNFNDPVSKSDGELTTLEQIGSSGGLNVESFQSDSTPKTLNYDGILAIINHGDSTTGTVTINYPTWGNYSVNMQSHNIQFFPIKAGTTISVSNDGAKRNTFFYYH